MLSTTFTHAHVHSHAGRTLHPAEPDAARLHRARARPPVGGAPRRAPERGRQEGPLLAAGAAGEWPWQKTTTVEVFYLHKKLSCSSRPQQHALKCFSVFEHLAFPSAFSRSDLISSA